MIAAASTPVDRLDETHDPKRTSWVSSANRHDTDFPIQNLPMGIFSPSGEVPRAGIAIGDSILDVTAALHHGLFKDKAAEAAEAAGGETLNPLPPNYKWVPTAYHVAHPRSVRAAPT